MTDTPNLDMTLVEDQQDEAATPIGEFLHRLDAAVLLVVTNADTNTAPGSPTAGDRHILSANPPALDPWDAIGATAGDVVYYDGTGWIKFDAVDGWFAWNRDENGHLLRYNGTTWVVQLGRDGGYTDSIAANGTTQGTATALTKSANRVVTASATNDGAILPAATGGQWCAVVNSDASDDLKVYPASGDQIDAIAVDSPFTIAAGSRSVFVSFNVTNWFTF